MFGRVGKTPDYKSEGRGFEAGEVDKFAKLKINVVKLYGIRSSTKHTLGGSLTANYCFNFVFALLRFSYP